jgi:hypothetical protein
MPISLDDENDKVKPKVDVAGITREKTEGKR